MRVRFESLQVLRGVACLLVVVYHIGGAESGFGLGFAPFRPFTWFGFAGVDLFFVLSGFIIASTCLAELGKPARLGGYLFRRVWRIFPTYWVALFLAGLWYWASCPDPLLRPDWPRELADTVFLLPQTPLPRIVPVAWSLSYELMFYAGFAALFLLPRRAAPFVLTAWGAFVVWAGVSGFRPTNRFAILAASPFVLEFLLGCLIAWVPVRLSRRVAAGLLGVALVWCVTGVLVARGRDPGQLAIDAWRRVFVFALPAALAVLAFTGRERAGAHVPRGRLSAIGDASYSIYLIHSPLLLVTTYLSLLAGMSHTRVPHCAWLAMMCAAGVVPGLLLYRYVEAPLLRLGKRKRPVPQPVAEAPAPRTEMGRAA